jgi:hypothetical protein
LHGEVQILSYEVLLLENHVEIYEKCDLERYEWDKELFESPGFHKWVVEFNELLDTLL